MDAIIHRVGGCDGAGLLDVAGQPLVIRQLQWLRALGVERVAVELGGDTTSQEIAAVLQRHRALAHGVVEVPSSAPLGPREVARRAGLSRSPLLLMLGEDVLGSGDLLRLLPGLTGSGQALLATPESVTGLSGAEVAILRGGEEWAPTEWGPGWGLRLRTPADALAASGAALRGELGCAGPEHVQGVQIHATEVEPGIWLGRGAVVEPGARLDPPVLIGTGAIVRAGAVVSGGSVIGAGAAVERGALVHGSLVASDTVVGEDVTLNRAVALGGKLVDAETGEQIAPMDPLLLGSLRGHPRQALHLRLLGLLLLALALPILAVSRISRRGARETFRWPVAAALALLQGRRALVGVGDVAPLSAAPPALRLAASRAPRGVFDIEAALLPPGASETDRLRARAWYAACKSPGVDASLLLTRLEAILRSRWAVGPAPRRVA